MGKPNQLDEMELLVNENEKYGDVLVTNTPEGGQKELTLKVLIAFKFTSCYCPHVEYVAKSEDDVYFEVESLEKAISSQLKEASNESIRPHI